MNKNRGSLTVEASVSLMVFWFFMMFILNAGQIYRAQNYVNHGLLQTGKMLAYSSYDFSHYSTTEAVLDYLGSVVGFHVGNDRELYSAWNKDATTFNSTALNGAAKRAFSYCAGPTPEITNSKLKEYGLKDGIDSINFTASSLGGDLKIDATYDVQLPFGFFGFDHVTLHQHVKCGLWS